MVLVWREKEKETETDRETERPGQRSRNFTVCYLLFLEMMIKPRLCCKLGEKGLGVCVHVCAVVHAYVYAYARVCYDRIESRPSIMLKMRDSEIDRRLQTAYTT